MAVVVATDFVNEATSNNACDTNGKGIGYNVEDPTACS
jgi:hypothetical protein